jgi:serine/threonine protein kinase
VLTRSNRAAIDLMHEPGNPFERTAPTSVAEAPFPVISGYRFQRALGRGGMATVYLATQESLDRPVSIKVMGRDALQDETSKQRFENEARTIAKLSHTGIVGIHEVGRTAEGQMYYVMPYLPNGDLSQRDLRNDETRIIDILRSLLSALGYAHSHGIVHRDVKEENVLFDSHDRPLLTDFGIARSKRDTSRLTSAGLSVGSSGFMAPEQARGEEVDGRADLYSVGVLTYALLTGQLPFRADDPLAMAIMHAQDSVPRLPVEKRHWQGFIDRAMAKAPGQRYANAQQMLQALERIGHEDGDTFFDRLRGVFERTAERMGGKNRLGLLALFALMLLLVGGYATYAWLGKPTATVAAVPPPVPSTSRSSPQVMSPVKAPPPAPLTVTAPAEAVPEKSVAATPPPEAKPAAKPTQTTAQKPVPAKAPAKKKRSWFSRLFHRR